ncbi:MAG: DUF2255 family protein [Flavobacteriaceae bacterium]|nr:DUF2255 family protein [Flavobacteriaceae bacterium]
MKFPEEFIEYLSKNTIAEIKGGIQRDTFLAIWVVSVDDRVFARSWNRSPRSWFTEILITTKGQIKYGDQILNISGKRLHPNEAIHTKINDAYLKKYVQKENIKYAKSITHSSYSNYTMEFFLKD